MSNGAFCCYLPTNPSSGGCRSSIPAGEKTTPAYPQLIPARGCTSLYGADDVSRGIWRCMRVGWLDLPQRLDHLATSFAP